MIIQVFVLLVILLVIMVPVGIALLMVSMFPGVLDSAFAANAQFVLRQVLGGLESTPLLAIPLFMLSGIIMARGGVSKKLFDVFSYFIGGFTGGMPCAVVITCLFYGAISGSAPATTAAVGAMTIPILVQMGYKKDFCAALVAVSGGLGVIIPPSIPFIIFGLSSGASVGALFKAGIIPGILIGCLLMLYTWYYCKTKGEDKEKIGEVVREQRNKGLFPLLKESFWALLSPVIILGGIYSGIVTPTEAAVVSVIYALIVGMFIYRTLKFSNMKEILVETVKTLAPIMFILGSAAAFGKVLAMLQAPQAVAGLLGGMAQNKIVLLLMINLFLLVVGMIMDTSPAILILTPILLPLIDIIGMNHVHFGIMMVVNLAIGFVTPPVGINLYVASTMTEIPPMTIARKAIPLLIMFAIALLLITFIPQISLALS